MKLIIAKSADYESFCRSLAGMEVVYAEFLDNYEDGIHLNSWLIYTVENNQLQRHVLRLADKEFSAYSGGLWEVLGKMVREKRLLNVDSKTFMSALHWLKPDLETCTYEYNYSVIKPSGEQAFWRAIYNLYYRRFLFYDSSRMLGELCALVFETYHNVGTSPEDWERAILVQRQHDGLAFNLDYSRADEHNLGLYLAREAYAKIGEQKLREMIIKNLPIMREMHESRVTDSLEVTEEVAYKARRATANLASAIEAATGEDLTKKYQHYEVVKVTDGFKIDELYAFFQKPQVVDFSAEIDEEIRMAILADRVIPVSVEYYLRNRLFLADWKPLTDLWAVICHILRTTDDDSLFYVAGSILNELWIYLPEKNEKEVDFHSVIYNLYWPRVKSLRLISQAVRDGVETSDTSSYNIFIDAMTWIFCIPEQKLKILNPKLVDYVRMLASQPDEKTRKLPSWMMSHVLGIKYKDTPLKTQVKKVLENFSPIQAGSNLGWCETVEEAELILDLLLGNPKKPYQIKAKEACLEKLLIRRSDFKVKEYVLRRLTKEYDLFVEKFNCDTTMINGKEVNERIFFLTAACEGAIDTRELKLLRDFAQKFESEAKTVIEQALELAEKNIKTFKMQRKAVVEEAFLETVKSTAEIDVVDYDLERFLSAQKETHDLAVKELSGGKKYGHYMWYSFPQLKGLGKSDKAEYYGLEDEDEAKAYMKNETLRNNLLELCEIVLKLDTENIEEVFPFPDNLKLRSCATLFAEVFPKKRVFQKILDKYYQSEPDEETLRLIDPFYERKKEVAARKDCPCNYEEIKINPKCVMEELSKHTEHLGCIYAEAYKLASWFSLSGEYAKQAEEFALAYVENKEEFINESVYNESVFYATLRWFPDLEDAYWRWTK